MQRRKQKWKQKNPKKPMMVHANKSNIYQPKQEFSGRPPVFQKKVETKRADFQKMDIFKNVQNGFPEKLFLQKKREKSVPPEDAANFISGKIGSLHNFFGTFEEVGEILVVRGQTPTWRNPKNPIWFFSIVCLCINSDKL